MPGLVRVACERMVRLGRWLGGWLAKGLVGLACTGACLPCLPCQEGTPDSSPRLAPESPVPVFPSAQGQLDYARKLKLRRHTLGADQRAALGMRAVHAYRAVRLRFPQEERLAQEASFRAGQLLVTMGYAEAALDDFFYVARAGFLFADRARMEIGHVHRRRGHWELAQRHYSQVANDLSGRLEVRASAQLLRGDMSLRLGHNCAAQAAWRAVINGSHDSRKRVLAFDRLARVEIEFGNTLRLAELLMECLHCLDDVLLEHSEEGRRARRALDQSQLVRALATP